MLVRDLLTRFRFAIEADQLNRFETRVQRVTRDLRGMSHAVLAVSANFAFMGTGVGFFIKRAGEMEQWKIAFDTMLQSGEKAKTLIEEITFFAKTTPFELRGLVESSKQLLAYKFTAGEIIPTLNALGNISAGVGRDKLPRLILALGQVRAAGKLTGAELRQFTETGVPLLNELVDVLKVDNEKNVIDLISKGQVGFKDVQQALKNLTSEGGMFFNLMQKQSGSAFGLFSNLLDIIGIVAVKIGDKLLPTVKELLKDTITWIETNEKLITSNITEFLDEGIKLMKGTIVVFKGIIKVMKAVTAPIGGVTNAVVALSAALLAFLSLKFLSVIGGITLLAAEGAFALGKLVFAFKAVGNAALIAQLKMAAIPIAIGLAVAGIFLLIEDFITFLEGGDSFTGILVEKFIEFGAKLKEWFGEISQQLSDFFIGLKDDVLEFFNSVPDMIEQMVTILGEKLSEFGDKFQKLFFEKIFSAEKLKASFGALFDDLLNNGPGFLGFGGDNENQESEVSESIFEKAQRILNLGNEATGQGPLPDNVVPINQRSNFNDNSSSTSNTMKVEINTQNLSSDQAALAVEEGVRKANENMLREAGRDTKPSALQ